MKTEETKELDLKELALNLSESIKEKRKIHYALSVAVGCILNAFDDRDINEPIENDHPINCASTLIEEARKIAYQSDELMDKLNNVLFLIKSEN